jgi:chlorobactene glucosyltransferase
LAKHNENYSKEKPKRKFNLHPAYDMIPNLMKIFETPFLFLIFFTVAACVWVWRGIRALRSRKLIPILIPSKQEKPPAGGEWVSVIIPAKNEEKNIRRCVESLQIQNYPNFEILVVNDNSTDQTETILQEMKIPKLPLETRNTSIIPFYKRTAYLNCPRTPAGWTGKNFALATAIAKAKGHWLLFTDADTVHEPHSLSVVMNHVQKNNLALLSLLPRCIALGFSENLLQPFAMATLGLWFPMEKVNDPKNPLFFANGQYLLIERRLYEKMEGHQSVKQAFLEDFALMKKAKQAGAKTQCALGSFLYGTRMYDSFVKSWRGWRRIYLHAFQKNGWVLLQKSLSLGAFSVLPFVLFIPLSFLAASQGGFYSITWIAGLAVLLLILLSTWKTFEFIRISPQYSLLHPIAAFLLTLILWDALGRAISREETKWR